MVRVFLLATIAWLPSLTIVAPARGATVYFLVAENGGFHHLDSYILPLSDPAAIQHARDLIEDGPAAAGAPIVTARIAPGGDGINRDLVPTPGPFWSWHVTEFLGFADFTAEIYDGWPTFVEDDVAGWIDNTDGIIGFWGYTVVAELSTVPEPHGAVLAVLGAVGAIISLRGGRRRQRRGDEKSPQRSGQILDFASPGRLMSSLLRAFTQRTLRWADAARVTRAIGPEGQWASAVSGGSAVRSRGLLPMRPVDSRNKVPAGALGLVLCACAAAWPGRACGQGSISTQTLYKSGTHGYYAFRIPALTVSNAGTLLAFAEGRYETLNDRTNSEIVLRRSEDGGQTWDDLRVLAPSNNQFNYTNASPIVDRVTGEIIVPFIENRERVFVVKSSDDGLTWSAPEDITSQVKDPSWGFYAPGPGASLQLDNGRIIVPSYHRDNYDLNAPSQAHVFYSDDHGLTWQIGGTVAQPQTNEAAAVQLVNGDVAMFMRNSAGNLPRYKSVSGDDGETWAAATQVNGLGNTEVDGSVIRYTTAAEHDANRILFSTPDGGSTRQKMSVMTSYDETATWAGKKVIYWGKSAYSDLAVTDDLQVNLLYERGRQNTSGHEHLYQEIVLAQFDKAWLESTSPYFSHWDFNEGSAGAASGIDGAIRDSSGWSMHAQAIAGPQYVAGKPGYGQALRFTDSPDRVFIDQDDTSSYFTFFGNDSFTIEAQLRTTSHGAGGFSGAGILAGMGNSLTSTHWYMQIEDGGLRFALRDAQGNMANVFAPADLDTGEWVRVAATRDGPGNKLRLYINGVQVAEVNDPTRNFLVTNDVVLGEWADLSRSFVGDMDFLRFTRGLYTFYHVPEPASCVLLATGLVVLAGCARRRRAHAKPRSRR